MGMLVNPQAVAPPPTRQFVTQGGTMASVSQVTPRQYILPSGEIVSER